MHLLGMSLIFLLKTGGVAAEQGNTSLCYILDGILIVYGIVLTVLYCRLRMRPANNPENPDGGIYAGLGRQDQDPYETLHDLKKKPIA